jgi:hypothetical protein
MVSEGSIDTWDFQWVFTGWRHKRLSILPNVNLVRNIGFGSGATHTSKSDAWIANLSAGELGRLRHPSHVAAHRDADQFTFNHVFRKKPMSPLLPLVRVYNWMLNRILRIV